MLDGRATLYRLMPKLRDLASAVVGNRPVRRGKLVRAGAFTGLAGALVTPLVRKQLRVPSAVTVAACAVGPLAVAVLWKRSPRRDVGLFATQMWGFMMAHEVPHDDPEALRRRLKVRYTVDIDRRLGGGTLPNTRLQRLVSRPGRVTVFDRALAWVHWLWFLEPYAALIYLLVRHPSRFPRAARQMAAVFDIGCGVYFAAPTAPPWWAAQEGYTGPDDVRRIMVEIGEETWGPAWPWMYGTLGSNPWAAMPSLHFATSVLTAILLAEADETAGALASAYAAALGFALVYLGEHYVIDLIAGTALVLAVRGGEPLAEPFVDLVNGGLRRLEAIAAD